MMLNSQAAVTLAQRELIRFFRQRQRVFGAIAQPVIFWLLFGAGLAGTFQLSDAAGGPSFREYFFPGTLALILLFTAIFSSISIIEDRREGFLQSVLIAPIARWAMVLGKVAGGTLIAVIHAMIFLALALLLEVRVSPGQLAAGVGVMFLIAWSLASLGFALAWRLDSVQGFHAIMSVLLLPMWLLSGAFFPAPTGEGAAERVVAAIMAANPLTYSVAALRQVLAENPGALPEGLMGLEVNLGVTVGFAVLTFAVACATALRPGKHE